MALTHMFRIPFNVWKIRKILFTCPNISNTFPANSKLDLSKCSSIVTPRLSK
ncbi:unnamed protein product [Acanthoscelides obtectus]|uniref:Uncharacterized protein n=1 Tax=Acanthoscelides obtectus TaxID=200917 RepID=A0A9P0NVI0_ACAOB|nr:unnamed protein product [Acanthoscelides obtectus]CAK1647947.1 hypothetical protein AOBTE_LOCUS15469 [Acanthoscelides obtectus]